MVQNGCHHEMVQNGCHHENILEQVEWRI